MANLDFDNWGLATADITYRRPGHKWLLQSYVWQEYDFFPEFPELVRFLEFWRTNLDGPVVAVSVAHRRLITPSDFKI